MKFATLALLFASTSAVKIQDDCKGSWCNKGLPYDLDEATLRKAEDDNVKKNDWYDYTKNALSIANNAYAAASSAAAAAQAVDSAAATAKSAASADFAATSYLDSATFAEKEAANKAAVKTKEDTLDARYRAEDDQEAKRLIFERAQRDFDAANAAKKASDANLLANQERVAYEKDQLLRGQNQDRLKFVNLDTSVETNRIQARHWERQDANVRLMKSLASF